MMIFLNIHSHGRNDSEKGAFFYGVIQFLHAQTTHLPECALFNDIG